MASFRHSSITALALTLVLALGGCGDGDGADSASTTATTAPSGCPDAPTEAQAEGPYFTPDAPRKTDLTQDGDGAAITVRGVVYDASCATAAGVRIDVWQTDADGFYDNEGFRFRGHQLTDARGGYELRTVVPGAYTGRTEHIHVKLSSADGGGELLTTQLYVPGASDESEDGAGLFQGTNMIVPVDGAGSTPSYRFDVRLP